MIMGRIEPIRSSVPLEVKLHQHSVTEVTEEQQKSDGSSSLMDTFTVERHQKIVSKIDTSGLTSEQREMVRTVIREEWK